MLTTLLKSSLIFLLITTFNVSAQDCNCTTQLKWLIDTFETNDAGFQYVVDKKGVDDYEKHNESFLLKASATENILDCGKLLYEWTNYFRSGHLGIKIVNPQSLVGNQLDTTSIIAKYKNTEKFEFQLNEIKKNLDVIHTPSIEGIWKNRNYIIGLIRDGKNEKRDYVGFIIEADSLYWQKKMVKLELINSTENDQYLTNFYMQDHSKIKMTSRLVGNNFLQTGDIFWKRLYPEFQPDSATLSFLKHIDTRIPIIENIDQTTTIVRIPTFNRNAKKQIDSLLQSHHQEILSKKNLIIDVRNNGGGSDASYAELLPYLYTNPIRSVGVEFLSTPLNNERMKLLIKDPNFSKANKIWFRQSLKKLNKNLYQFVNLDDETVRIKTFDTVYQYPSNIAILINEYCGSTTEEFLLAAKQSRKVKLLGKTTSGVLDFSNQHFVKSPCEVFELVYSISKSKRLPYFPIDNIGIQPDYLQDETINDEHLVQFAIEILNQQ